MKSRYIISPIIIAITSLCFTAKAEVESDKLVIYYKDGSIAGIHLSEMPQISFVNGELCLNGSSTNINCPLEDITHYSFTGYSLGTDEIAIPNFTIVREQDIIKISTEEDTAHLSLFDLQGRKLNVGISHVDNYYIVDIETLVPGGYILSINSHAIKLIKE